MSEGVLAGRKVFIATPAYEGKVGLEFVNSLIPSIMALQSVGAEVSYAIYANSGSIPRVRNQAVATVLANDYSDLMFIDADMGWRPEDLVRVLAYDTSMVGAAYPARSERHNRWIVVWPEDVRQHNESGLLTAERVGTGFLRVRRDVLEALKEKHGDLWYRSPHVVSEEEGDNLFAFFDYQLVVGRDGLQGHVSEDYVFCDRARDAGFTIWVDPYVKMQHVGSKVFEGTFADVIEVKDVE